MTLRELLAAATKEPWNLVWWGNETFPYPLSILADEDGSWITRGGHVNSQANARLIALAPQLAEALIEAQEAMKPFSEMAGEMFAANWNDDGVAISFVTKNGPLRLTFRQFRAIHATATRIDAILGERDD